MLATFEVYVGFRMCREDAQRVAVLESRWWPGRYGRGYVASGMYCIAIVISKNSTAQIWAVLSALF